MDRAAVSNAIRRPESAAVAGLVFAGILSLVLVLFHGATSPTLSEADSWLTDPSRRSAVTMSINLIPFAGIAFLWFIAVFRANLGSKEDRFFETVFLGSGLLFIAAMFAAAASLKAVLSLDDAGVQVSPDVVAFAWTSAKAILGLFGARMAAVFVVSATTAAVRTGGLPRWMAVLGYLAGLALLLVPPLPNLGQFLFPLWVALISILVLVRRRAPAPA